jgi:type III secretion protein W
MADRIEGLSGPAFRSPGGTPEETLPDTRGTWQGETVEVGPRDAASLLADAMEELTFALAEEMEVKEIKERKVEEEEDAFGDRVHEIHGVWKMLEEQLPDLDLEALRELFEELVGTDASEEEIARKVGERFRDPTHADAALDGLEKALRAAGDTALADRVATVRERFRAENGPAIRAGLNVTGAVMEVAAGDRAAAGELRDLYRATVFGVPGPAGLYRGIISQFGIDGFADRIRFLTRAAGDDLAAAGPSVDPVRLQELIRDLSALRVLDTVHERCGTLAARLERQNGVTVTPTDLLQHLLPLTEETVSGPSKPLGLPERLGLPASPPEAGIMLLREAREVMGMMPVAIYRDMDARAAVLRGMQEAMDIMIEREEAGE